MSGGRWRGVHRWIRRIWVGGGLTFTAWIVWNMQSHGVDPQLRQSSADIRVTEASSHVMFEPAAASAEAPVIFLPGGGVSPNAYVPFVRRWAEAGHRVALVYLPWRVAFTEGAQGEVWRRIEAVIAQWNGVRPVLAGHSRGAALAARFAGEHADRIAGLVLIGTTHPRDHDLSSLRIPVLKVAGSRDCVAPVDDSRANAGRLPPQTVWAVVDGANHAQFGHYGSQLGDCTARITREDQQRELWNQLSAWLGANGLAR
jgi:pimeloyl-ACP methyl ester carboxylesterase